MKIIQINLPNSSLLKSNYKKHHYIDCFQGSLIDKENAFTPTEVSNAFFYRYPIGHKYYSALETKLYQYLGLRYLAMQKVNNQKKVTISTVVLYNNWFGRFYFFLIKPMHKIIMKVMLKTFAYVGW